MRHHSNKIIDPSRRLRITLTCITFTLIAMGVVMIYSASAIFADQRYGDSMFLLKKHLLFVVLGFAGMGFAMVWPYDQFQRINKPLFWTLCAVLLGVAIFAPSIGGAKRWIPLGPFRMQPSEFAKLSLILYTASYVANRNNMWSSFKKDVLPLILSAALLCGLVLLGKDLGTMVVMGGVFIILLFASGIPMKFLVWLVASGIPVVVMAIVLEPYRMKRLVSFLNPWQDIQNAGFQLYQSLLAIGAGGVTGVGLGQSQQKLFYLPAAHTDFIFAIIGEELGFLGAGLVILLFMGFLICGWLILKRCDDDFGKLLTLGCVSLVMIEATINVGVSIGAFPTKGLALPFISYGGSSLLAKMILVGCLLNVSRGIES